MDRKRWVEEENGSMHADTTKPSDDLNSYRPMNGSSFKTEGNGGRTEVSIRELHRLAFTLIELLAWISTARE